MRHPFDGLIVPVDAEKAEARLSRRDALATMVASAVGLGAAAVGHAQVATDALNEQGGVKIQVIQATTLAVGEEGGVTKAANEEGLKAATTEPFGEEAGKVTSQRIPGLEDGARVVKPVTEAVNEAGGPPVATTQAVGEEGGPLTAAVNEAGGGFPVAVQPGSFELPKEKLTQAWADLGAPEAGKALQACALLYGHKQAVSFLKDNLKLDVRPADEKEIARLVALLDDNAFATREKAEAELVKIGLAGFPALLAAQAKAASVEVKMRLGRILVKVKEVPAFLQAQRGLEVLVALRSGEARQLLESLTKAAPETVLSQLAKNAQGRIAK